MLIELTMALPCTQRRPASITLHFDESIMIGTREMSGSLAIRFRKRTMAAWLSSMASSMLMSMICAPFSTCWRATASACSNSPFRIIRANALEPVTLVRSPMLTNSASAPMVTGSRPDRRIGSTTGCGGVVDWVVVMARPSLTARLALSAHRVEVDGTSVVAAPKPGGATGFRLAGPAATLLGLTDFSQCPGIPGAATGLPRIARDARIECTQRTVAAARCLRRACYRPQRIRWSHSCR
jgi:hypothetical protein